MKRGVLGSPLRRYHRYDVGLCRTACTILIILKQQSRMLPDPDSVLHADYHTTSPESTRPSISRGVSLRANTQHCLNAKDLGPGIFLPFEHETTRQAHHTVHGYDHCNPYSVLRMVPITPYNCFSLTRSSPPLGCFLASSFFPFTGMTGSTRQRFVLQGLLFISNATPFCMPAYAVRKATLLLTCRSSAYTICHRPFSVLPSM